jgi:hypothetical protein
MPTPRTLLRLGRIAGVSLTLALTGCATHPSTPTALSEEARAGIAYECAALSAAYSHHLDAGEADALAALFTSDGVWQIVTNRMQGREVIARYWLARYAQRKPGERSRHVISNELIEVIDRDHAKGFAYFAVYSFDADAAKNASLAPGALAQSHDEYERTAQGWRIKLRRIEPVANVAH